MLALDELNRQIELCRECDIAAGRTRVVPGEGAADADIMFIGEAPGYHEDQHGRPFVGAAGKFLDELLAAIGLDRTKVYIANIVKCRPPSNRDPQPGEIANCRKWLESQIENIRPRMIVTLGRFSMARYFPGKTISKIHGTWEKRDGIVYFAMYHPAAALHQQGLRGQLIEDIKKIPDILAALDIETAAQKEPSEPQPQQMSLFGD
ncbi:uracil-DNA glycosylase [Chloroflexota bacterium]